MRKKMKNILVGSFFLVIGIGFLGKALGIWYFNLFFDGWWTLLIIVPCVLGMVRGGINRRSLIGVAIGILLLLWQSGIFLGPIGRLFLPVVIIIIGLLIIFKDFIFKKFRKSNFILNIGAKPYIAILGAQNINYDGKKFAGCDIVAVLGGVEIDLRNAIIEKNVEISAITILGGGEIFLPKNVQVKVTSLPILGGIDNKVKNQISNNAPTVHVNVTCILGGLGIR